MSDTQGRALPASAQRTFETALQLQQAGRLDEAERGYRLILGAYPLHAAAMHLLGMIAAQRGRNEAAVELIGASLALEPNVAEAHYNLGAALQNLRRTEEAVAAYRRSLQLKPNVAGTHLELSVALQELGYPDEARAAIDRALALDPTSASAWHILGDLKTYARGDPDIEQMEALLASGRISADDRILLEFALGKAWMDVGDSERAFAHLDVANRLKRAGFSYDSEADVAWLAAIAEGLPAQRLSDLAGAGDPSDMPVFVVGMPRSGTTLVEQILASHPRIHGAGELLALEEVIGSDWERDDLAGAYLRRLATLAKPELASLGRAYVERVSALAAGRARVVDKSPGNFRLAGLITLMLPNARIIHCRRDSADTCLSCYTRNFSGRVRYAFDQRELGRYHRAYQALMGHWRAVLPPERFIEVDYEAVVADLEPEARRLIDFCGLDWDPACLDFHATRRPVRTFSVNQVRRPLYSSSVARWKPYERQLKALLYELKTPLS